MTTALKSIFDRLSRLPAREQEAYAEIIRAELDGDKRWEELLASTTEAQWGTMVADAQADVRENGTMSLDELKARL